MSRKKGGLSYILRSKKALSHEIFFNIFELALVAVVTLALFLFISDVAEQTIFQKALIY